MEIRHCINNIKLIILHKKAELQFVVIIGFFFITVQLGCGTIKIKQI